MRTAIFLGCVSIADAIRADWFPKDQEVSNFFCVIVLCFMFMDVVDFFKKNFKTK